jgi:hypothetical protein
LTTPSDTPAEFVPTELHTRFLYPFFFDRDRAEPAAAALTAATIGGHKAVWGRAGPPGLYADEMLEHVTAFLFSDAESNKSGPRYLRVTNQRTNSFFHGTVVQLVRDSHMGIVPAWEMGIELFLTPQGIGILSVTLTADCPRLDFAAAASFNYRLSLLNPKVRARIGIPHPADDPAAWARIPEANRAKIKSAPPADAPLAQRLGVKGGSFTVAELIDELLEPLDAFGKRQVQPQLSVYTVARFGPEVDLEVSATRDVLGPFVSTLAQIEEPTHSGAPLGVVGVTNAILNRRHWAAVGLMAAAHLIADQPAPPGADEHPFNQQRMNRIRDKYFVSYLLALIQRFVLHRAVEEANAVVLGPEADQAERLSRLRGTLLRFAVGGHFSQVSSRHVLHRFYRIAQEGLDVPTAWDEVRHALADIDAQNAAEHEGEVARDMAKNLTLMARTQSMIEWIEIFLVSVYAAHLWHMFAGELHPLHHFIDHYAHGMAEWVVSFGVIFFAALGAVGAALFLKPWKHGSGHH